MPEHDPLLHERDLVYPVAVLRRRWELPVVLQSEPREREVQHPPVALVGERG